MKLINIPVFVLFALLVASCSKKEPTPNFVQKPAKTNYYGVFTDSDWISVMHKQVDISQVVAYGSVNTNDFPNLVVTISDIWKGTDSASGLGITNGTRYVKRWTGPVGTSRADGRLPEGAVLFVKKDEFHSDHFLDREVIYVTDGQIYDMSIESYKTMFGL